MAKTTDAMKIIDNLIGDDAQMREMLAEASLNAEVGQLIYDARQEAGLTQQQLAELVGTTQSVTFRDLPEAITQGENIEDALNEAADCLEEAIANRVIRRLEIPTPSEADENEYMVTTPLQTSFKASIWLAMEEKNINQTQLAKNLNVDEKEVRRILDPSHNTKLETLERLRS